MRLPAWFCWSKYGAEAGEEPEAILERKEHERRQCDGIFLWGIGNSIRPSLVDLLRRTAKPEVLFTPMFTAPSSQDVAPVSLRSWRSGIGLNGSRFRLPKGAVVTSKQVATRSRHFALVCYSSEPLKTRPVCQFSAAQVRNLRSGAQVGSSQVTSVVQVVKGEPGEGRRYEVTIRARLVSPFFVTLDELAAYERDG